MPELREFPGPEGGEGRSSPRGETIERVRGFSPFPHPPAPPFLAEPRKDGRSAQCGKGSGRGGNGTGKAHK